MAAHKVSNFRFPPEEVQRWRECATDRDSGNLTAWLRRAANAQAHREESYRENGYTGWQVGLVPPEVQR